MSKRLGGIKGCKYKTSFMVFKRVKISLLGLKEKSETLLVCGTFLNLRGVECTCFALFYCFLVREKLGLQVYMFGVYSIAGTVAKK